MPDIVIKNTTIVTVNTQREILYGHSLLITGDSIARIALWEELEADLPDGVEIIDGRGKIVFPGLINTHNHLFQTLLKGLGDDKVLKDWLKDMTFPGAANLTRDDVYTAAKLGCIEGIRSGTTTMLDYMYPHPIEGLSDGVIDAFRELKIRGIFGRGMMNTGEHAGTLPAIMQDTETIIADLRRLFEEYHDTENRRIRVWAAPAAVWSCSAELLSKVWELVNTYESGISIHISETPFDRDAAEQLHGLPDAEVLEELGIVGPNVLMVHCVYLTERDMRMAQYYDMKVSHNTVSNMYLSSGVAPIPRMLSSGITVGLGSDGPASNNSQDMIELMKFTALLHKVHTKDPTAITAEKVLEMATIDGARAVGLEDQVGSLEVGKKADLFIYDPGLSPKSIPLHHPVSTLVYSGTHAAVETVIVDGNILLRDGEFVFVDEQAAITQCQTAADNLAERAGIDKNKYRRWKSLAF